MLDNFTGSCRIHNCSLKTYIALLGVRQVGKAADFDSAMHRFESCTPCHIKTYSVPVAVFQSIEYVSIWKCGRVRFIATVLKTVVSKGTVSSNLTVSARLWRVGRMVRQRVANPSSRNGCIGSIPILSAKFPRFRIMDNTVGFYPTNMGSIPVGEARVYVGVQLNG